MIAERSLVRGLLTTPLMVLACTATLAACAAQGGAGDGNTIVNGGGGTGSAGTLGGGGVGGVGVGGTTGGVGVNVAGSGGTGVNEDGVLTSIGSTPLPCDVSTVVQSSCGSCHSATPIGGAPMPLVTHEDWHRDVTVAGLQGASVALKGQTMKAYEIAKLRIAETVAPMPPTGAMEATAFAALDGWLAGGAVAGTDPTCMGTVDPINDPLAGAANYCDNKDEFGLTLRDPLVARPGEKCYDFLTHGASGAADTSPFMVGLNESYSELYYAIPWGSGEVMTRFGADFDNLPVLHHYLLFSNHSGQAPGSVVKNVTGTTLGTNSRLIAGWAVGGCGQEYPPEVGMWLPEPNDGVIMIQWHHYNNTGAPAPDNSKVQICTVPAGARANVGDVTHLGTENFNSIFGMPPGPNDFTSQCTNNSGGNAYVVGWMPHMHLLGVNMKTAIKRLDGSITTVFDKPFKFDYQIGYPQRPVLEVKPGETLITTCSFNNTTGSNVAFGQSTNSEMCYQFASYYPIGSLVNGVASLLGSTNTCW